MTRPSTVTVSSLSKSSIYISLNNVRGLIGLMCSSKFGILLVYRELIGKGLKSGSGQGLGGGILAFLCFRTIY